MYTTNFEVWQSVKLERSQLNIKDSIANPLTHLSEQKGPAASLCISSSFVPSGSMRNKRNIKMFNYVLLDNSSAQSGLFHDNTGNKEKTAEHY